MVPAKYSMYGFIYVTENILNGKKYVGQRAYKGRWHLYLGSGTLLRKAIKAHGATHFRRTIIEEAQTAEELNSLEAFYVEKFNAVADPNWYNLVPGGHANVTRGFTGKKHSEETKAKMRVNHKRTVTENVSKASAANAKRMSSNKEARAKQSAAISGAKHFRASSVTIDGITYPTITAARKAGYSYQFIKAKQLD